MTEERYSLDHTVVPQSLIREHGVCMEIGVVVDKLNMLSEERNQFQFQYNMEVLKRQSLEKENERLKQQVEVLSDLNNDELASYEEKILNIINTRITYYQHKPFSAPITNPANPNYDTDVDRLARLSELKELKKELHR